MKRIYVLFLFVFFVALSSGQTLQKNNTTSYDVLYQMGASMNVNRMGQYALKLSNGNIFLIGGHGTGFTSLNSAEVYNPTTNSFSLDTMNYIHDYCAAADLSDGTWLIAGGAYDYGVAPGIANAEIYDPLTNSFTQTNSMVNPRMMAVGTRLKNNNVLIVGGWYDETSATYGELYNFSNKTFTSTQALVTPRSNPIVISTNDTGAVVFGGSYYYGGTYYETVEYYNPQTNSFTQIQDHLFPNDSGWVIQNDWYMRPMSSQLMKDGKYLFSAYKLASSIDSSKSEYGLGTFDPATKQFAKLTLNLPLPSTDSVSFFESPIIDTSKNLAYWLGIKLNTGPTYQVFQLYVIDLNNLTWHATKEYTTYYYWSYASMTLIHDGTILIAGGTTSNDSYTNFNPVDSTIIISVSSITDVKAEGSCKNNPIGFSLKQNYPNPFNPSTIISYQIPKDGIITLKIYDILGREVKTLVNEYKPKGNYSITFNASQLSSGVYFYRINASGYTAMKKMILMK